MLFVSFHLSPRLSSMHRSGAARCWQVLQCASVKSLVWQPPHPLPHPVATSPCTLCSHSFELRKRKSVHRNNGRKAKDRENNMREDKVCEWKEVIHILQTDKLLQQQRQADRGGDRQKPRQSFWLWCWKGKWKLSFSLFFSLVNFPLLSLFPLCSLLLLLLPTSHTFPTEEPH